MRDNLTGIVVEVKIPGFMLGVGASLSKEDYGGCPKISSIAQILRIFTIHVGGSLRCVLIGFEGFRGVSATQWCTLSRGVLLPLCP